MSFTKKFNVKERQQIFYCLEIDCKNFKLANELVEKLKKLVASENSFMEYGKSATDRVFTLEGMRTIYNESSWDIYEKNEYCIFSISINHEIHWEYDVAQENCGYSGGIAITNLLDENAIDDLLLDMLYFCSFNDFVNDEFIDDPNASITTLKSEIDREKDLISWD